MICVWRQPNINRTGSPRRYDALGSAGGLYRKQTVTEQPDFSNYAAPGAAQPSGATARAVIPGNERSTIMSGKMDQVKGRIKEAAGVITNNDRLRQEGKVDQVVGKVKDTAAKIAEKVKDKVEKAADTMKGA
jgi:uncharacterized protein YjbJ (UPF0337 family)